MICKCKQCGREFILTEGEIEFYKSKNLNLPKRCKDCRKNNQAKGVSSPKKNDIKNKKNDNYDYFNKKSSKPAVYIPSASAGKINVKTVCVIAGLIVIAVVSLLIAKKINLFNSDSYEPNSFTQEEYVYQTTETNSYTDYVQTETTEETVLTSVTEITTVYDYTQQYYSNSYRFRNNKLLTSHYEKHGIEMGFSSKEAYEAAASAVITNPDALTKPETDDNDGDTVYFIRSTGEIVFLSADGYIRSYFIATEKYYNKQ